jgi:hypothetical protein
MTTRCNHAEVVFLRLEENRANSSIKPSSRSQSKNARAFNEGEEDGFENKAERRCETAVSRSMASVSRAGRDERGSTTGVGGRCRDSHVRVRSGALECGRGGVGELYEGDPDPWEQEAEKLPFGPSSRMLLSWEQYSINVGECRVRRWALEMTERTRSNLRAWSRRTISRCAPLRTAMLEISALMSITLAELIDRFRRRFLIGARRREFRREG